MAYQKGIPIFHTFGSHPKVHIIRNYLFLIIKYHILLILLRVIFIKTLLMIEIIIFGHNSQIEVFCCSNENPLGNYLKAYLVPLRMFSLKGSTAGAFAGPYRVLSRKMWVSANVLLYNWYLLL